MFTGQQLNYPQVTFGCDPEFFFQRGEEVVGSEKVLTTDVRAESQWGYTAGPLNRPPEHPSFVQDGVQVELNPSPNSCRANLGNEIAAAFRALRSHLNAMGGGITASFRSVVEVSPEELATLGAKAKALGCAPSLNYYDQTASVTVDGATYRKRSAGGHIHLGLHANIEYAARLVPIMDLVVGNTCVLIDRDPHAAERRLHYGRASEYRLPSYGLEYRTLSNFWLQAYPLFSFVLGLSRLAVAVLATTVGTGISVSTSSPWDAEAELLKQVDAEKVRAAINQNDFDLALENYQVLKTFVANHHDPDYGTGLNKGLLPDFDHFVQVVKEKGLRYWFPMDPIDHWCALDEGHGRGWESFVQKDVRSQRFDSITTKALTHATTT